jgi:hypothetical protein
MYGIACMKIRGHLSEHGAFDKYGVVALLAVTPAAQFRGDYPDPHE